MEYKYEYICKMKQPVVCELCNKSYAIGRMKAHKQTKMHKENAEKCGVPSSWWFMGGTKPNAFVGHYNKQPTCLNSAKLRSTDSVNPRAVLSRVRPRYRLYSKHRDRRCWTGPGIGIRVSFRTLERSQLFRTSEGTGECGRVEASAP